MISFLGLSIGIRLVGDQEPFSLLASDIKFHKCGDYLLLVANHLKDIAGVIV